jgi:hypothetical protein
LGLASLPLGVAQGPSIPANRKYFLQGMIL